jgi:light-regulated signal transduction histidine kinase (bacteriophytochrome)
MTVEELKYADLMGQLADLEELAHYRGCEIESLQREIEAANKRAKDYERIALDLGATMRQIAKYAQLEQGGTI